ncbi:jg25082 [Pararge aegeria aegeria]|uniref:Jg25082 protein n=1 Tax=Pararge aegeria aegeria TaxID=348720 RepID=A0A8S4QSZ4_9NEOP|nr:jg25082 [Pararge aegeria aegeria]
MPNLNLLVCSKIRTRYQTGRYHGDYTVGEGAAAVHADASLTQVRERQMSNAAERGGRLCLLQYKRGRGATLSLVLQVLNGTPQSEVKPGVKLETS